MRRPSPALVVATIALVIATGGTAVAAIDYAANAGAVDGKSAISSSAPESQAPGKLVATATRGPNKGKVPGHFISDVAHSIDFGRAQDVTDNAVGGQTTLVTIPTFGTLSTSCEDQSGAAGTEDPSSLLTFTNQAGNILNLARQVGNKDWDVLPLANGTVTQIRITGSNTFRIDLEHNGVNALIEGTVRQDGRATPAGSCLTYGVALITS